MMMLKFVISLFLPFLILIAGCNKAEEPPPKMNAAIPIGGIYSGGSVLVNVNNEPVYEEELEFTIARTFSQAEQLLINEDARQKLLDSLIAAHAMRQAMEKQLDEDTKRDIERKVNAYREELYVKAYLQAHTVPEPVSQEMVEAYYYQHPEKFGGGVRRQFEMLRTTVKPSEEIRDLILASITDIKAEVDWQNFAKKSRPELGLVYQKGDPMAGVLDKGLSEQVTKLEEGEIAGPLFLDGIPHVIRVVSVRIMAPKPLSEVSADIRKYLAPLQLRAAVKQSATNIVKASEIEYIAR